MDSDYSRAVVIRDGNMDIQDIGLPEQSRSYNNSSRTDRDTPRDSSSSNSGPAGVETVSGGTTISFFSGAINPVISGSSFNVINGTVNLPGGPAPSSRHQQGSNYPSPGGNNYYESFFPRFALPPGPSWRPTYPPYAPYPSYPWHNHGASVASTEGTSPHQDRDPPRTLRGRIVRIGGDNESGPREYFRDILKDKQWTPKEAYAEFNNFCDDVAYVAVRQAEVIFDDDGEVTLFDPKASYRIRVW